MFRKRKGKEQRKVLFILFKKLYLCKLSGGKPGAGGLSKKDQILQQNIDAKRKQQIESDKLKIEYATRLKTNVTFEIIF